MGAAREAYDAAWPESVQHALIMSLLAQPASLRDHLRLSVETHIARRLKAGEVCDRTVIDALITTTLNGDLQ